jgi:hypothetical protein
MYVNYCSVLHLSGRINFAISKDAALDIITSKAQFYPGSESEVYNNNKDKVYTLQPFEAWRTWCWGKGPRGFLLSGKASLYIFI